MKCDLPFHSNAVWPPLGMVGVFVLAYAMIDGGVLLIEHGAPNLKGTISSIPEIMNIRAGILATAAGLYALYRLWRFHPVCHPAYAAWLNSSPWTPARPLPFGPVHLVWQDAVVVGILAVLAHWQARIDPTLPLIVFGVTYLVAMTLLLAFTRTWLACLLLGFLWPALGLPVLRGPPMLAIFAAMALVIWYGHRQSLRALPWRRENPDGAGSIRYDRAKSLLEVDIRLDGLNKINTPATINLGWPFQCLSPKVGNPPIANSTSSAVSLLFGWWTYCAIVGAEIPSDATALMIFFLAALTALFRFAIYCSGLGPSFNLWGRFASGQLIVPGYDQVFVIPLLVIALAIAGGIGIRHAGLWYPEASACLVGLVWFALLNGKPTLRTWVLTGQHRYRSPGRLGANKQLLRPI
jgi:hypothetical protein